MQRLPVRVAIVCQHVARGLQNAVFGNYGGICHRQRRMIAATDREAEALARIRSREIARRHGNLVGADTGAIGRTAKGLTAGIEAEPSGKGCAIDQRSRVGEAVAGIYVGEGADRQGIVEAGA